MLTNKVQSISVNQLDKPITISSDLAAQHPVYLYLAKSGSEIYYSTSLTCLLNIDEVEKPLTISKKSLSFLLQCGVVPPPKTIYEDIFVLSIGDQLICSRARESDKKGSKSANRIAIEFVYKFPFTNKPVYSGCGGNDKPDINFLLELLANATLDEIDHSLPSTIFHSAGKDSNMIALALAEAGKQKDFVSLTYAAKGKANEETIVKELSEKMGFEHLSVSVPDTLNDSHYESLLHYFEHLPLPSTDNATLLYPLLNHLLMFDRANVVDGMGGDIHIGHIPERKEYQRQKMSYFSHWCLAFTEMFPSESRLQVLSRSRAECTGMSGFSVKESFQLTEYLFDCKAFWGDYSRKNWHIEYPEFRAMVRGGVVDVEVFTRKVRNAGDVYGWNVILPWANQAVAEWAANISPSLLYDTKSFKNKLILRQLLLERLNLDSDNLGKMAFEFGYSGVIASIYKKVEDEILRCQYWNKGISRTLLKRLVDSSKKNNSSGFVSKKLIHRLFVISAWLNHCRYL